MIARMQVAILIAATAAAVAEDIPSTKGCARHHTRSLCLAFRRQDLCAWDTDSAACVEETPCDERSVDRCEYELTTGGAPWDRTINKCFVDKAQNKCRWSDECLSASSHEQPDPAGSCAAAGCQWTRFCKQPSMRLPLPGLHPGRSWCVHKCAPPGFRGGGSEPRPPSRPTDPTADLPVAAEAQSSPPPSPAPVAKASEAPHASYGSYGSYDANGTTYSYEPSYSYDCCGKPPSPPGVAIRLQLPDGGGLSGRRLSGSDTFLGIPFAEAPIGELRWAAPRPITPWGDSTVLDATSYSARCQPLISEPSCIGYGRDEGSCAGTSEDCLTLNIFAPLGGADAVVAAAHASNDGAAASREQEQKKKEKKKGKAVMVWIHGGCYGYGSSSDPEYDGSPLASTQDVVVVTVNYRLGALGWLGHDALRPRDPMHGSTGNYGLLDNIEALRWVHRNIEAFGGDPARVTIFGESSGAGSVSQLLGVPAAWPYFHQAIMESGAASAWTTQDIRSAYHNWDMAVQANGCAKLASIEGQVLCLLDSPSDAVAASLGHHLGGGFQSYCRDSCAWTPIVDGALVRAPPLVLARNGMLRPSTRIIAGHNLNDGGGFVPMSDGGSEYLHTEAKLLEYFARRFGPNHVHALLEAYPEPPRVQAGTGLTKAFMRAQLVETDYSYACPSYWLASANAANGAPSYVYQFSEVNPHTKLCLHGYELQYVFGTGDFDDWERLEQQRVANITMSYWASFARTGVPSAAGHAAWPEWTGTVNEAGAGGVGGRVAKGAMMNISGAPAVVNVEPLTNGCPIFDTNFFLHCLPMNPSFNVSNLANVSNPASDPKEAATHEGGARRPADLTSSGGEPAGAVGTPAAPLASAPAGNGPGLALFGPILTCAVGAGGLLVGVAIGKRSRRRDERRGHATAEGETMLRSELLLDGRRAV
jgi:para-nitrobenzyl esterase